MSNLFPYFPIFLDLAGRAAALIGGDAAMAGLARRLLAGGAGVSVFDAAPCDAIRAMAPTVRLKLRRWRPSDFHGARLVAASGEQPGLQRARIAAHAAGAIFLVLDAPELSDVALGGVAVRGAMSLGVSAPGAAPALAEAVRARLEAGVPQGLEDFFAAAARARPEIERRVQEPSARAAFWCALVDHAFAADVYGAAAWDDFIVARMPCESKS